MKLKKSIMIAIEKDRSSSHISRLLNDDQKPISELHAILEYLMQFGKPKGRHYKISNNTHVEMHPDDSIAIRLHEMDIATYYPDQKIVLNSGGWRTVTTKERMNSFSPAHVWSYDHLWTVSYRGASEKFKDGVILVPRPPYIKNFMDEKEREEWEARKRKVMDYCREYDERLKKGKLIFDLVDYRTAIDNSSYFFENWKMISESEIMRMIDHNVFHGNLLMAASAFAGYHDVMLKMIADNLYLHVWTSLGMSGYVRKFLYRKLAIA